MAKNSDHSSGALDADRTGLLSGLFAEENEFDRRSLWRIGTWGLAAVGAVVLAVATNQWSLGLRRDQVAAIDVSRQAQQIQSLTRESQNEARRLANAIDTLNNDRDRLFSRMTVLEQGLDSVTGTIAKQATSANTNAAQRPPPSVSPPPATMMPPSPAADSQPQAAAASPAPAVTAAARPPAADKPAGDAAKQEIKTDVAKADTAKADAARSEPAKAEPAKTDPVKTEPAPGAIASLPQIAAIRPATPLQAAPPAQTPPAAQPLGAAKSMMGPPDPAAPKLVETAKTANAAPPATPSQAPAPAAAPEAASTVVAKDQEQAPGEADANAEAEASKIQRTEFAVELGGANSISGLRALWRGLLKSNNAELAELRPIIVLREGNTGLGMQLRLAAGPLPNAADAARICASLIEMKRACEATVFDGQRLAMNADEQQAPGSKPATNAKPSGYSRRYYPKHGKREDPPAPAPEQKSSSFSSLLGLGKR